MEHPCWKGSSRWQPSQACVVEAGVKSQGGGLVRSSCALRVRRGALGGKAPEQWDPHHRDTWVTGGAEATCCGGGD